MARKVPFSGADTDSVSGRPVTVSGPRLMFQLISPFDRNCAIIASARLPVMVFGAACSIASRMAVSEMAAGVTINEVRESGLSGGTSASTGLRSAPPVGNPFRTKYAPAKAATSTSVPAAILPKGSAMAHPFESPAGC